MKRDPIGYFALKCEILGMDRILDVHFDAAPPEPAVGYGGYLDITSVKFNGVELIEALTKEDLQSIKEEIEDYQAPDETDYETAAERRHA